MTQIRGEQISYVTIGELSTDPVAPHPNQLWMLKTDYAGQPIGLLLALTYTGRVSYQLSYKTNENTIIRTALG